MIRRYFEQELRFLHESGKTFAEAHPEVARYLNVDSLSDRDPYVERLFEGFAFLSGRVHERLDDALPEYTESLIGLLYPHFLKPVPALCLVELKPKPGLVQETTVLERGVELRSVPVGEEAAVCRFTTTHDVTLQPLTLEQAQVRYPAAGSSTVHLAFRVARGASLENLDLERLRLYLHADVTKASAMHLHLTRHVRRVEVMLDGQEVATRHGQQWIRPVGLGAGEGLLPYGPRSFSGYRLLHEYLCFRPKFWGVDLLGLDGALEGRSGSQIEVRIVLDRPFPEDRQFSSENVRLHCVPAVNLFEMEAEPIRVEGYASEYRIVPSLRYRRSVETYDVLEVDAIQDDTGKRMRYRPFFDHRAGNGEDRYFTTRRRVGALDRPELYLSLSGAPFEEAAGLRPETLSVRIRATNGSLPRERLQEGMITQLAPHVPQLVEPTNLRAPTLIYHPPTTESREYFWKLISHLSLNHRSLASAEALVGVLELYDWTETSANRRRLAGIRDVRWEAKEVVERGALMRGAEVTVEVQEGHFADEGDLGLFGLVLSAFLSTSATINSFVHLKIVLTPSNRTFEWKPQRGAVPVV